MTTLPFDNARLSEQPLKVRGTLTIEPGPPASWHADMVVEDLSPAQVRLFQALFNNGNRVDVKMWAEGFEENLDRGECLIEQFNPTESRIRVKGSGPLTRPSE